MLLQVFKNYEEMCTAVAGMIASRLKDQPNLVLGLATGSTPLGVYKELIRMHCEEGLDFSKAITFNLDEYVGLDPDHPQSYHYFMFENFFNHINIDPDKVHIPDGTAGDVESHCEWYDEEIKRREGIDIQLFDIGVNGQIGFNEPGSSLTSRTRIKTLTEKTTEDNMRFAEDSGKAPQYAITMGIGTIMEAKEIIMLASGVQKAYAVKSAVEGPISALVPASIVQMHRKAFVMIDQEAASELVHFVYE